jgi:GntR family transcriptional regulator
MRTLTMDDPLLASRPDLSETGDLPAYMRIGYWLERLIVSRKLDPGDRLPPEVDIATALGVSRMTLRQALASIEAKGLIDRRRGRFGGNFVAMPRFEFDHASLPGFTEQMRRMHVEAGAHVIRAGTRRPTPEVRQALRLKYGEQVHEVMRARSANGEPLVLEETYFPAAVFPGMLAHDLTGSLYAVMREYKAAPYSADEQIEAARASDQQAEILNVAAGDPLLLITRTSSTVDGLPVEFSRDYHRSDRTRITIKSRVDGEASTRVVPVSGGSA